MDEQDRRRQELRMSVEASPEAPSQDAPDSGGTAEVAASPASSAPPVLSTAPAHPQPVTACTSVDESRAMAAGMRAKANPAEWVFDRLSRMIMEFESKLSPEEEIGATIVGAPGEGTFHVDDIGFWGPDLIMFYGKNMYGRSVRLIQHYQQLSILLNALPREQERPARRIGFALRSRIEEEAAENAPSPPAPPAEAAHASGRTGGGERP